jgi:predicted 3-demethylubiquinone-9 3-methyltransferase (glyoxalase superfamily)
MARSATPFLMFEGSAEAAMTLYVSLFKNSAVTSVERYGAGGQGPEGSVKLAHFTVGGSPVMCIDSPVKHNFAFTPAVSVFVECEDEAEMDQAFGQLSKDGLVLMPPGNYGFSTKFTWVSDRFGVSWQLNLK